MTADVEDVVCVIRSGDKVELSKYLDQGIDPNVRNKLGWTLLHIACLEGKSEIAEHLINKGASVNSCTTDMSTPLHRAASQGCGSTVEVIINKGAYINAQDKNGNTPLHEAARNLHTNVVKILIEKKADRTKLNNKKQKFIDVVGQQLMPVVEIGDVDTLLLWLDWNLSPSTFGNLNWSILHHASARGQINTASLLLERGANVNALDSNKSSALHAACFHGNKRIVELLIGKCANVNAKDQMGNTPLHSAISGAHPDIINILLESGCDTKIPNSDGQIFTHLRLLQQVNEFLIDAVDNKRVAHVCSLLKGQANPDTKNSSGCPVLCIATFKGDLLIADALLEAGANPNLTSEDNIKTPLHYASIWGHFFILKSLLDKGANVSAKDKENKTPLHEAARHGCEDMVVVLVGRCSPMDAQDDEGNTPLHMAAKWGHTGVVDMLLEKGSNDKIKNNDGHVYLDLALMRAVRTEDTAQVMACLAWGGDPNTKDCKGWSLLHHAAYKGAVEVCRLLIESLAEVNLSDNELRTPLLLGAYRGNIEIMLLLMDAGADMNKKDKQHQTPLHWAAEEGSIATVDLLLQRGANRNIKNKEGKLYNELLLKHLYFAVRHNDQDKVQCLLQAGADQTAVVRGTETSPRDEAKRRKNFSILKQMLSVAPKKKVEEDVMAIEFISYLFEECESSSEDETSSSNQSDDLDSEEEAHWKMQNATVIIKEKDMLQEESELFWKNWEEKPTVISAKDWCKEDIDSFWQYWEEKAQIISAKDYFKEDIPWWQECGDSSNDSDDSNISDGGKCFIISFQDAKKKWGNVISAKEFFKEDECWWRDAVNELYSSDEEADDDISCKVLSFEDAKQKWGLVVSAKEFFREDECWWRDAVEELSSSSDEEIIDEIEIPTMSEINRKWDDVILAKDVFNNNDPEWLNSCEEIQCNMTTSKDVSTYNTRLDNIEVDPNSIEEDTNTSTDYKDCETTSESWDEVNDSFPSNTTLYSISEGNISIVEPSTHTSANNFENIDSYESETDSLDSSNVTETNISNNIHNTSSKLNSLEQFTIQNDTDDIYCKHTNSFFPNYADELNSEDEVDDIENDTEITHSNFESPTIVSDEVSNPKLISEISNNINKFVEVQVDSEEESEEIDHLTECEYLPEENIKINKLNESVILEEDSIIIDKIFEYQNLQTKSIKMNLLNGVESSSDEFIEENYLNEHNNSPSKLVETEIKETEDLSDDTILTHEMKLQEVEYLSDKLVEVDKKETEYLSGKLVEVDKKESENLFKNTSMFDMLYKMENLPEENIKFDELNNNEDSSDEVIELELNSSEELNKLYKIEHLAQEKIQSNLLNGTENVLKTSTKIDYNNDDTIESSFTLYIKPSKHSCNIIPKNPHVNESTESNNQQTIDSRMQRNLKHELHANHSISPEDVSNDIQMVRKILPIINMNTYGLPSNILDPSQVTPSSEVEACLNSLLNAAENLRISNLDKVEAHSQPLEKNKFVENSGKSYVLDATNFDSLNAGTEGVFCVEVPETNSSPPNIMVDDYQLEDFNVQNLANKNGYSTQNGSKIIKHPKNVISEMDDCLAKVDVNLSLIKTKLAQANYFTQPKSIFPNSNKEILKKLTKYEQTYYADEYKNHGETPIEYSKLNVSISNPLSQENNTTTDNRTILSKCVGKIPIVEEMKMYIKKAQQDDTLYNKFHSEAFKSNCGKLTNLNDELMETKQNTNIAKIDEKYINKLNLDTECAAITSVDSDFLNYLRQNNNDELIDQIKGHNPELSPVLTLPNDSLSYRSSNTIYRNVNSKSNIVINEVNFCNTGMSSDCTVISKQNERDRISTDSNMKQIDTDSNKKQIDTDSSENSIESAPLFIIVEVTIYLLALTYSIIQILMSIFGVNK